MARYLYGDSTPFPLGYNFLTTLEAFMSAATRIVQLDVEGSIIAKQRDEVAQNRVRGLEALEQFHTVVMRAVQDTAAKVHHQHALDYARAVAEYATQYIEDHRRATLANNERESLQLRGDGDRRASEMRAHLDAFLKASLLPVVSSRLALRLNIEGKDARHSGSASFEHPDGIASSFTLAPMRAPSWQSPRKVSDFASGVDLRVGVEKSWLSGKVSAKQLNVDDWTIMQIDLTDDTFELTLRKKLTEREMLTLALRRHESGATTGTVEHGGMPGAESLPSNLAGQDVAHMERLWTAIKNATREVLEHKEQLLGVTLDSQPVFEGGLAVPFVVRLVAMFAPTVREIAKRSPNEVELTLKVENESGRREELYLRKEGLLNALQPLPAKGREVFAPLGLDSWVPAMTTAPPPVVATQTLRDAHERTAESLGRTAPAQEGPPSMPVPRPVDPASNPFIAAPPSSKKVPG
ncbi:MAG: hypothetical protein KIT84_10030 [Labilithrix sp.]|nr:hypothetical protein [Labilithrix sp.]MCW5811341.1 hypothetical protein [Labilithrix sp.]